MAEAALTETLADTHVDDILTGGRLLVSERVRKRTQELCDRTAVGVRVSGVALVGAEPPRDVVEAFQDVQNAKSDRERLLNEASGYANETLPRARGAALDQAGRADGERTRRVAAARGDAERFGALRQAAASDRASFRQRAYLETLERLLPRTRVFVVDPAGALRLVQPSETPKKRP
jgi:membrane protease subunit HflK